MPTKLGEIMRELRTKENERLLDMAKNLHVSSAFLSAVEHGRKIPPRDLPERLFKSYQISPSLQHQIRKEVASVVSGITIRAERRLARETASVFARKINKLSDSKLEEIRNLVEGEDK